jgi:chemotaxis receptor (MCP) glutamine deamidase CheD
MDRDQQEVLVPLDQFVVARTDVLLCAQLSGSLALCLGDDVEESGALLHMQAGRPGRVNDPELTDNTLSTDLLLIDRCMAELKLAEPRARHWQARIVAHADMNAGGHERLAGIRAFIEACLDDAGIRLVSCTVHDGVARMLSFRPAMSQLRCEPLAGPQR